MKVVLDTNILFSGIAHAAGTPGRIVRAWLDGRYELVLSEALLAEFERILRYPKIRKLLAAGGISDTDLRDYADMFRMKAQIVTTTDVTLPLALRDPKDVPVLEALLASGAEFLVTGDKKDLLSLGMPGIVSAADFLARLEAFTARREESERAPK